MRYNVHKKKSFKKFGKRHKMGKKHSRRLFSKTAVHVHKKNRGSFSIMRGGIRL